MTATSNSGKLAVAVLGMHRSGTSCLARLIHFLGADLGEDSTLVPSDEHNPAGYWEDDDVNRLHEELLREFNYSWHTVPALPSDWRDRAFMESYRGRLSKLVALRFRERDIWAWKEPRTCLFLPIWREVLAEHGIRLKVTFIVRSPLEVAASLRRRDGFSREKAFGLWLNYNLSALAALDTLPTVFVSYDGLLGDWEPALRKCAVHLGLPWPEEDALFRRRVAGYLDPGLRHSAFEAGDPPTGLPAPVARLDAILHHAAEAPAALDPSSLSGLRELVEDFRTWSALFSADLVENTAAKENAELRRRMERMQSTWSWRLTSPLRARFLRDLLRGGGGR